MRRWLPLALLVAVLAVLVVPGGGAALAHGGKSHQLLGTIKELHEDHLLVTSTDGHEVQVTLTEDTRYEKDEQPAKRSDLAVGQRVSVQLTEDDKTAIKVKIGAASK